MRPTFLVLGALVLLAGGAHAQSSYKTGEWIKGRAT
jgi:hypothetical protein